MLLGLAVPEVDRIGATQAIRARHPAVVVIVLSDSCLAHDVLEAI